MVLPSGDTFARRYGPVALIAGGSEGIGAAFARELAGAGLGLVLVARRASPLDELASELRSTHGVDVRTVACDLQSAAAADTLVAACAGSTIGLLVYNAAASSVGPFLDTPVEDHVRAVEVNARGPILLTHAFAGPMARRGRGGVILVSSLTAFQGTPLVASYGATKAFNLVLAEGLWAELADRGVDVLACCAGATLTAGYERVTPGGSASRLAPRAQTPAEVAREALGALGKRPVVITGFGNRVASLVMRRVLTRTMAVRAIRREMRKRYS
jgi:short-subunit dehydrogenase